jgi:hypothetical protein
MASVFSLLINDRHSDPEISLFRDRIKALAAAYEYLHDFPEEEVEYEDVDGWMLFATYSSEGDYVRLEEIEVED